MGEVKCRSCRPCICGGHMTPQPPRRLDDGRLIYRMKCSRCRRRTIWYFSENEAVDAWQNGDVLDDWDGDTTMNRRTAKCPLCGQQHELKFKTVKTQDPPRSSRVVDYDLYYVNCPQSSYEIEILKGKHRDGRSNVPDL